MLVLTRKLQEEIIIRGDIVVKVAAILIDPVTGSRAVRLAIGAPDDVSIHRSELLEQDHGPAGGPPAPAKHRNQKNDASPVLK